jgi:predicted PilT family ATPase
VQPKTIDNTLVIQESPRELPPIVRKVKAIAWGQEMKQQADNKKKLDVEKKAYAALINEANRPKVSKKKQRELEELKKKLKTKTRLEQIATGEYKRGQETIKRPKPTPAEVMAYKRKLSVKPWERVQSS